MNRTLARLSLCGVLALGAGALSATPMGAATAPPVQSCAHVTGSITFTPGLTNTPANQTVAAKGNETGCTPAATTGGSAALKATIHLTAGSCAKLAQGNQTLTGGATSTWKNAKVSHYNLTFKTGTGSAATTATITGTVSSGLFVNHKVTGAVKFTPTGSPNCTTKPVKTATFASTKPLVIH